MSSAADIICLLDDEPSVLKALGRLLASEGLQTEKFSDPLLFLEHARSHSVRLAVIDIRMPGMTGLEVLEELRTMSPEAQAIILTGEHDSTLQDAAMAGGARAFFLKPFNNDVFLRTVRESLSPNG